MAATIQQMLELLIANEASDLHLIAGHPPMVRIHGVLMPIQGEAVMTPARTHELIWPLLKENQQKKLEANRELDLSYQYADKARFRVNVYTQRDTFAAALRLIPARIKTLDELRMPSFLHTFTQFHMGLVLVTGPTGTGKSSTLAAILDEINAERSEHILTIEDPIEFVYTPKKSIISQREVESDTLNWGNAMRSALREDPNIVLVGEMRDLETISAALTVAETGHVVFATLHTNSGPETVNRIIDVFPEHQQAQIRQQLSNTLKAVVSQRLVPMVQGGGRLPAIEILMNTTAVSNLIREGKAYQIESVMQTSSEVGMMTVEKHLAEMLNKGLISPEEALKAAIRPQELERLVGHSLESTTAK